MPNRILKDSICTSDTINQMTPFQETFFYRLIVSCDDFGRMDARPAILKAKLFPLRDRMTLKDIGDALRALADIGCVDLYEVGGKPYLCLPSWKVHQTIRNKKSKYPAPEDGELTSADSCEQLQANASKCARNPIQSESNPNPESESESNPRACAFAAFWAAYPRKVGKEAARRAFAKVPKEAWPLLVPAINAQKLSRQWQKDGGQYIPNPATWLNQGRWEDEAAEAQTQTSNPFLRQLMEEESHG